MRDDKIVKLIDEEIETDIALNSIRKSLKKMDLLELEAVAHLTISCELFTFLLSKIDPEGVFSQHVLDDKDMESLKNGLIISQTISRDIFKR